MPMLTPNGSTALATLRQLATRGDKIAEAILNITSGTYWPSMSAGAESSNIIRITGQVKDQDGQIVSAVKHVKLSAKMALATPKTEVAFATTAALAACTASGTGVGKTLTENANAALTVDGTAVAVGDRILVKDQVAGADNGIYTVTATGSGGAVFVLTRATDSDTAVEIPYGSNVFVRSGKANAGKTFVLTTTVATIETTAQTWTDLATLVQLGLGAAGATIKSGSGSTDLWIQTSATGAFSVDVTAVAATIGDVLLRGETDNGEVELLVITFA